MLDMTDTQLTYDTGRGPFDSEEDAGLFEVEFSPKQVVDALPALQQHITRLEDAHQMDDAERLHGARRRILGGSSFTDYAPFCILTETEADLLIDAFQNYSESDFPELLQDITQRIFNGTIEYE